MGSWWPRNKLNVDLFLSYTRKGEGGLFAEWDTPWLDPENPDSLWNFEEPFPSGTVQGKTTIGAGINGNIFEHLNYSLTAEYMLFSNYQNIVGEEEKLWKAGMDIEWAFAIPAL